MREVGGRDRRIRLFYTISSLEVAGAEGQLVTLVTNLDRSRFLPMVCCLLPEHKPTPGPLLERLAAAGIEVAAVRLPGLWGFRRDPRRAIRWIAEFIRLVKYMRLFHPVIFHGFLFWPYVLGALAARLAGVPILVTSRLSLGRFKDGKRVHLALERLANRFTDLVVANSEAVRRDALVQELLRPGQVVVAHNGIDTTRFQVIPSQALRDSLLLPAMGPITGVVANLRAVKGHRYFLEAWRAVVEVFPSSVALIVGDGPMRRELEEQARTLGIGGSIRFLGSRRDVPELLALMDLVVHPSLEEGFPNAILEAMAAGKAVVATNVGGSPEAVVDGVTGLLVPPADSQSLGEAILKLLGDRVQAVAFGEAGRERVGRLFDLGTMARKYEALYAELVMARGIQ